MAYLKQLEPFDDIYSKQKMDNMGTGMDSY